MFVHNPEPELVVVPRIGIRLIAVAVIFDSDESSLTPESMASEAGIVDALLYVVPVECTGLYPFSVSHYVPYHRMCNIKPCRSRSWDLVKKYSSS
jgi:hypothetical protein